MINSMAKCQRIFEEDCDVDRILSLPGNVIDRIMELMPLRDAARTCVLSTKWRYVWADHPTLVLDKYFWADLQRNRDRLPNRSYIDFAKVVSSILLYHFGKIRKFVIDVSVVPSGPHSRVIDLCLSSLSRRSLQHLDLIYSKTSNLYTVPSWVFSSSELTHLTIINFIMKTKDNVGCFSKIKCLVLQHVSLDSWFLTTPLLTSLILKNCRGIRGFNIDAPRLALLILFKNDYLNLKTYLTCTGITKAVFFSTERIEDSEECQSLNLIKLASAWPSIQSLATDGFCLKCLTTGNIAEIVQLNLRSLVLSNTKLDLEVIASILRILKISPLVHTFQIQFFPTTMSVEVNRIDERSIMDYKIEQLRTVKMRNFSGARVEVMFAEILLQCAPLLEKMLVKEDERFDPGLRIKILKELLVLQRAFPKTNIVFRPNLF